MSSTVLLTTTNTFQITRDLTSANSTEIIAKRNIVGIYPTTFESKANYTEPADWKYRYDTITIVTLGLRDGSELSFELQDISNQSSWNGGTLADLNQAIDDIKTWLADMGETYIIAAGGTVTRDGNYLYHTITSTDNFIISQLASNPANNALTVFGAGGAAGGGGSRNGGAGGGGGGEANESTVTATLGTFPAIIGSGGLGGTFGNATGFSGSSTTFMGVTYAGGGGGGNGQGNGTGNGGFGACGGGGGYFLRIGGTGAPGFNGGTTNTLDGGAGGGGMGSVGSPNSGASDGGSGGLGILCSIDGNYYGAGGGGGAFGAGTGGNGGNGVGGNGGNGNQNGANGATNRASGGGGSGGGGAGFIGGNGSDGIVIVKYLSPL